MTQALKRDLLETIQQAQMDDAVRVLVLTGRAARSAPATTSRAGTSRRSPS
jgi:enoyl-CoA hydratase/carnithine racemase